jgi:hypothetical protein
MLIGVLVLSPTQFNKFVDACTMYCSPTLPFTCMVYVPPARDTGVRVIGTIWPLALKTRNVKAVLP